MKLHSLLSVALLSLGLAACSDFDNGYSATDIAYDKTFTDTFGEIDPNQDWTMATRVTGTIDLSGMREVCEVTILNYAPTNSQAALLYQAKVAGGSQAEVSFDCPKNLTEVYVQVKSADGLVPVSNYFTVADGTLSAATRATRATNSTITLGNRIADDVLGSYYYTSSGLSGVAAVGDKGAYTGGSSDWDRYSNSASQATLPNESWTTYYTEDTEPGTFRVYQSGSVVATFGKGDWATFKAQYGGASYFWYDSATGYYVKPYYYIPFHYEAGTGSWVNYPPLYQLNGVRTEWGAEWKISDVDPIVGVTYENGTQTGHGVFNERGTVDTDNKCSLGKWYEELNAERGAEYVLEAEGPVEFDVMYGGTDYNNQFGYFYYADGATEEEIYNRPRYLLAESASISDNIKVNGSTGTGGMAITGLVSAYDRALDTYNQAVEYQNDDAHYGWAGAGQQNLTTATANLNNANHTLQGRHYRLAYFGESGTEAQGRNEFPAGTHIVFFLVHQGQSYTSSGSNKGAHIEYSLPWLNKREGKLWTEGHDRSAYSYTQGELGELDAVTYQWGGQIILGFEDRGGDDDMNDILFFINGQFRNTTDISELKEEVVDVYEWLVACEDLGGAFDYDFNDVVFSVKKYDTQTTLWTSHYENGTLISKTPSTIEQNHYLMVTPLAAGGTLKSYITNATYSPSNPRLIETHTLLNGIDYSGRDSGTQPVINADRRSATGTPVILPLTAEQAASFSMTNGCGGFAIEVLDRDNQTIRTVSAPQTAFNQDGSRTPQMLVLPQGWCWPREQVGIGRAYPSFVNWVQNAQTTDWLGAWNAARVSTLVVEP